ncbi:cupin, partial [Oxalobacteraceae bacterium CAVE-383]
DPFRLTAWFGPHNPGRDPGAPGEKHTDYTAIDVNEGGTAIPYWMEDPYIRQEYEAKLKAINVNNRMDPNWYLPPERK